ncbi:MAG: DNA polymerase Y family protein [Gammaproteobacteria bacterium]|nr:DNA polymerase Y family protein [Gammaproteobacteria bacterium]
MAVRQQSLILPEQEVYQPPDSTVLLSQHARRPQLWLALRLPQLPVEVFPATDGQALAVVATSTGGRRVQFCNPAARRLGLRPGLTPGAAFVLAPNLHLPERSPWREQQVLQRLAGWASQYTSLVSLEPPDGLLLEIHGSLRLFGGLSRLWQLLEQDLASRGHRVEMAVAPTAQAALWLARGAPGSQVEKAHMLTSVLSRLSLQRLNWPKRVVKTLDEMGLRQLGDCLRLPREGFARRLGAERLAELDRALGRIPEARSTWVPPSRFSLSVDLNTECMDRERLMRAIRPLFEQLQRYLVVRQSGIQLVELKLCHLRAPASTVVLRLLSPGYQAEHFHALLGGHMERIALPEPVVSLVLRSGRLQPLAAVSGDLLASRQSMGGRGLSAGRLVECLRARLGRRAVYGVGLQQDYRPDRAWRRVEPVTTQESGYPAQLCRPLWLLESPIPLRQQLGWPWQEGRLRIQAGPERIESGWWDDADISRDYYLARNAYQQWLWIYRERQGTRRWYLHGLFA